MISSASPYLYVAFVVWEVCGSEILDFFEALASFSIKNILKALLAIGAAIVDFFVDLITNFIETIRNLDEIIDAIMAACDPDDHIGSHTITINGPDPVATSKIGVPHKVEVLEQNIFKDADWAAGGGFWSPGY